MGTWSATIDYKVGDVVVVSQPSGFLVHRIVNINKDIVITKGDNNQREDECSFVENIKGKVLSVKGTNRDINDFYNLFFNKFPICN